MLCITLRRLFNMSLVSLVMLLFLKNSIVKADNLKNHNNYANIDNIFKQYNNNIKNFEINKSYNTIGTMNNNNIYVFISFSMGDNMLKNYIKEAQIIKQKYGINVVFVLNGFHKNSFRETQLKIDNLLKDLMDKQVTIIIDPIKFKDYTVEKVPTFLKNLEQNKCNRAVGAVSIKYVLEIFGIKVNGGIGE